MRVFDSKYEWAWLSAVMPIAIFASIGLLVFAATPLAVPVGLFFVTFWCTRRWPSLPKRIFTAIVVSIGLLWLIPLPSVWLAQHRLAEYQIPTVRAEERVKPFGHVLSFADGRALVRCDYQCIRFLVLPSVETITIVADSFTQFEEIRTGNFIDDGPSVTLKLAPKAECNAASIPVARSALEHPKVEAVLRDRCVVRTDRPEAFDLLLRRGTVVFGTEVYDSSYLRASYHDNRLGNGSVISRGYELTICPYATPLFIERWSRGLTVERDCIRTHWKNWLVPIDGLDFST